MIMDQKTVAELNSGGRKERISKKRRVRKSYADKDPLCVNFQKNCAHRSEKSKFKCSTIPLTLVINNRKAMYKRQMKVDQDIFLSRLITPYETHRKGNHVAKQNVKKKSRNMSCHYHLLSNRKRVITVCKKFFISVFGLTKRRLENLSKTLYNGETPRENRGGDRYGNRNQNKKQSLRTFLNNLPAKESHYGRGKSKRVYLTSEYNARKLCQLYNNSVANELKVKKTMFYKKFLGEFNIGFSSPASDACSICVLWRNKLKNEKDNAKKQLLRTELRIHKLRANAFYNHLRKDCTNSKSLCFDLQQVQSLPRTPIQDAFYARQLSLYNFCVVQLDSNNPVFYSWDESQSGRGATEIGSAVYDYLKGLILETDINHLRLFCDGCGGQNKNSHMVHMLLFYLLYNSPPHLKEITLFFPVRGHSFLPADRVFGRLEKEIRKQPVITTKEGYYDIFKKYGKLKILGEQWNLKDIKSLEEFYKKLDGIQSLKRIKFVKKKIRNRKIHPYTVELKCYENYKFESGSEKFVSLLKRGKRHPLSLNELHLEGRSLSENKKKDIKKLLNKQFGEEWVELPKLQWYKKLIIDDPNCGRELEEEEMENLCDCLSDEIGDVRI